MTDIGNTTLACLVICLDADHDNVLSLLTSLDKQGIDATVYKAVDGRHGYPALLPGERVRHRMSMLRMKRRLTSSEMGC